MRAASLVAVPQPAVPLAIVTLILSNDEVAQLLPMHECIEALEDAYLSEGRGVSSVRSDCLVPAKRRDAIYSLKSMDGVVPKLGIGAIRIDSDIVTWPKTGGNMRRVSAALAGAENTLDRPPEARPPSQPQSSYPARSRRAANIVGEGSSCMALSCPLRVSECRPRSGVKPTTCDKRRAQS